MHRPICRDRPPVLLMVVLAGVLAGTPTPSPAGPERDGIYFGNALKLLRPGG